MNDDREIIGLRIFYRDRDQTYYECFDDQSKVRVNREWLMERMWNKQKYQFPGVIIPFEQIDYFLRSMNHPRFVRVVSIDAVNLYHSYGLISDREYMRFFACRTRHAVV